MAIYVSEDATGAQCQSRYTRCLTPDGRRGPWSAEEDERLKIAVAAHGSSWVDVSACIPGRTNDQCRERWTDYLHPSISQTWSPAEDETLCESVKALGHQWKAIAAKIGHGKTGSLVRLHHTFEILSEFLPYLTSAVCDMTICRKLGATILTKQLITQVLVPTLYQTPPSQRSESRLLRKDLPRKTLGQRPQRPQCRDPVQGQ